MQTVATIVGNIHVVSEGPIFRCVFPMIAHGDSILGGLVGHLGETISKLVRKGDMVKIEGKFIEEKTFGKIFVIEHMTLPEKAKTGRLCNVLV